MAGLLAALGVSLDSLAGEVGAVFHKLSFPRASDEQVFALTAWAAGEFYKTLSTSATANTIAQQLQASGHLKIDPNRSAQSAAASLPASLRKAIGPKAQGGGQRDATTAEREVREELKLGVERLDARAKELLDYLRKEQSAAAALRAIEEERARIDYIARELAGIGAVGGFIFDTILNRPQVANIFRTYASAASSAYLALTNPALGPLAVAGTLADAANSILSLGLGAADPLVVALKPIEQRLDAVLAYLDVVTQTQADILRQLGIIYQAVLMNQQLLNAVRTQLQALATSQQNANIDLARAPFHQSRAQLSVQLRTNTPEEILRDVNLRNTYLAHISDCSMFAVTTARNSILAEDASQPLSRAVWRDRIRQRSRCDELIGVLTIIAGHARIQAPMIPGQGLVSPANPTAWAEGVTALLEGQASVPGGAQQASQVLLTQAWWAGWQIRELIRTVVTPRALTELQQELLRAAGLPATRAEIHTEAYERNYPSATTGLAGQLFAAAREWDSANVPRHSALQVQGMYDGKYVLMESSANGFVRSANIRHDYVQQLLRARHIELINIRRGAGSLRDATIRVKADGPWKDTVLGEISIHNNNWWYPKLRPGEADGLQRDPMPLQNAARPIALALLYRPQAVQKLPDVLSTRAQLLVNSAVDFEYFGEQIRLLGAFARWRTGDAISSEALSIRNVVGPFSLDEIAAYVGAYARNSLSLAGYWPGEIPLALHDAITSTCNEISTQLAMVDPSRSLQVIDDTMRRLAAYMAVRGIPVPDAG
jgi:hypothetical protein